MTNFNEWRLYAHQLRTGLCLAVALSVINSGRRLDILSSFFSTDKSTKEWLQECMCGFIRVDNCVNGNHLSRENEPWVRMSAICLKVLTYLIWILESSIIRNCNRIHLTFFCVSSLSQYRVARWPWALFVSQNSEWRPFWSPFLPEWAPFGRSGRSKFRRGSQISNPFLV